MRVLTIASLILACSGFAATAQLQASGDASGGAKLRVVSPNLRKNFEESPELAAMIAAKVTPPPPEKFSSPEFVPLIFFDGVDNEAASYDPAVAMSALWYSKTAYCAASAITAWNCATCGYHPRMSAVQVFTYDALQAYIGYDASKGHIVVAFRGSANIPNWISDLSFTKVAYPPCNGKCEVHHGFYNLWMGLRGAMVPAVQRLATAYPRSVLFVTGHSLGAAISIFAALDLHLSVTGVSDLMLYNFGEPRVGDANFVAYAANTLPAKHQFRVTHHEDPVPHLPPKAFGFLHVPHEVYYGNDGNTSFVVCSDSTTAEDKKCSDQFAVPDKFGDHVLYLGISTRCEV